MNFKKFLGNYLGIILILSLHLFLLSRIKFTAWPEMLLWPYLILKGWLPYQDIAIAHTPLMLSVLKSFFGLFGVGIIQLKVFTWSLILLTDILVFAVARRIWGRKVATLSLIFYSLLMVFYEGNGLWFELALTPLILLIFYFVRTQKYFIAGVFGGVAFLTKQTAFWIIFPLTFEILGNIRNVFEKRRKTIAKLEMIAAGGAVVLAVFVLLAFFGGILDDFWAWAIRFGVLYLPKAEGQANLPGLFPLVKAMMPFTVLIFEKDLLFWAFAGSLGALPRWELFHFQPALPFIAFSFSVLMTSNNAKWRKIPTIVITSLSFLIIINRISGDWGKETRFFENDVSRISEYVKEQTSENEKVLVLNSWDHFNVLTGTLPAERPWIPQLYWYMKMPGVEEKFYSDLVVNPPNFVIYHPYSDSGLDSYRPAKIADFVERYYYVDRDFGNFQVLKKR